ncbi:TolC family protein [Pollutibacter soli]|uniref:TolC family protein n=1 Tax=Pollutibacter soli TaxID=3034157 RepID=UPI0030139E47
MNLRFQYLIRYLIVAMVFCIPVLANAQNRNTDSLRLTIPEAEGLFLKNNLQLLAEQYNIDINRAFADQAKLWDNPLLVTDQNIYDGKFFRHGTENGVQYGEIYVQVQQLIRTAGKIKKQTRLANDNTLGAKAQFEDVMRNLRYVLSTDMNNLAQLQNTSTVYTTEISTMQSLVKGMDEMLRVGDISQKENIRVKALLFSLQNELSENIRQQVDLEKELAMLLHLDDTSWVISLAGESFDSTKISDLKPGLLRDSAIQFRPDLNFAKIAIQYQSHNIAYQKSLASPDLNAGVEYDKLNSYVPNYWGLYLALPLPVFNRNQGNIKAAKLASQQTDINFQQAQNQVSREVTSAWQKLINATGMLNTDNNQLQSNYDTLMKNMLDSYRKRQVSLIEFIDFFEAYKDTRVKEWQLITNQRNAAAELNFAVNRPVIQL